jgi:uncharacterized damage-inducible protein DinB
MAHVHELMGCFALSTSKSRVLEKLAVAILQYHAWLGGHGEDAGTPATVELSVVEEVQTQDSPGDAGGPDPLRNCDTVPATDRDITRCLQLLSYTRADLTQLLVKLPKTAFTYKPLGEPRSVRNALRHIADVDVWYLSRIRADPPIDESKRRDLIKWLEYTRSLVQRALPNLTEEQRNRTFHPRKWSDGVWPWTATKVLHRLVTHERQHANYLKRILDLPDSPLNTRN